MDGHGVFRHREFLATGATKHAIEIAVRDGSIRRLRWGWYATTEADPDVVEAVQRGGVLSCVSALARHGVWVPRSDGRVHVRGNSQAHRRRNDYCRQHARPQHEVSAVDDVPIALRHAIRCITDDELVVAVCDSILNNRLMTLPELRAAFSTAPARLRGLVEMCDARADSGLETVSRLRIHALGYDVRPQVRIQGVGLVDLLVDDSVIVELDGRQHRDDDAQYAKDRHRDRVAQLNGYPVLRLTYADVFGGWPQAARDLARLVELSRRRAS